MSWTRRGRARVGWGLGIAGGIALVLAVMGTVLPGFGAGVGGVGGDVQKGAATVAISSAALRWTTDGWLLEGQGHRVRVVIEPRSAWRPTTSSANVSVMAGGALLNVTLRAVHVPLAPLAGVLLVGWGLLRWVFPGREEAHACGACGYDLRGVAGVCPECGGVRGA